MRPRPDDPFHVPDDARDLTGRVTPAERRGRTAPSRGAVALLVAGLAALAVLLSVLATGSRDPRPQARPAPLAEPAVPPGRAGGLVPDVRLQGRVTAEPSRSLRPGAVVLVRPACDCLAAIRVVTRQAARYGLVTYLVQAGADRTQLERLAAGAGGDVAPYADAEGVFARAYRLHSAAALVLVRADGVVTRVIDAIAPSLRLDPLLRELPAPAAG